MDRKVYGWYAECNDKGGDLMKLVANVTTVILRFFIYGIVWGALYDRAGYMKSVRDVEE